MFDIGFSELLIIAVVALVVLGPERLPKAARFAGLWVRRARAQWYSVKSELERDLAAEELRRSLHDTREAMRGFEDSVRRTGSEVEREFDDVRDTLRSGGSRERDTGMPDESTAEADAATDDTPGPEPSALAPSSPERSDGAR
jgi:sec-independent protein translocase protein TatB